MLDSLGLLSPLPAPWTDDTSAVSEVRLVRWVRRIREQGATGLMLGTATGEAMLASIGERKTLLELVMRETQNAVPVVVDAQAPSTMASLDLAQHASRHGARGIVLAPMHVPVTDDELFAYFRTVTTYGQLPAVVVDPEGRIGPDLAERLALLPGVLRPEALCGPGAVYAEATRDSWSYQGTVVTPTAALAPTLMPSDPRLAALARLCAVHQPARVIKLAVQLLDADLGPPRGPWLPLTDEFRAPLSAALAEIGLN